MRFFNYHRFNEKMSAFKIQAKIEKEKIIFEDFIAMCDFLENDSKKIRAQSHK